MNVKEIETTEDQYEDRLNEMYGTVDVCGITHDAGTLLKRINPIAFNTGLQQIPLCYECGICGNVYMDEDKAENCCSEHNVSKEDSIKD